MSRLDSVIRRLTAQRDCLNHVATLLGDIPGPILEIGLGNGRTFDHLRTVFPDREIFAFDRAVQAHPSCIPDARHMIVGEIRETLEFCGPRIGAPAALIHIDLGQGDETMTLAMRHWLSPLVTERIAQGGLVVVNQELDLDAATLPLPETVPAGRYFIYRCR